MNFLVKRVWHIVLIPNNKIKKKSNQLSFIYKNGFKYMKLYKLLSKNNCSFLVIVGFAC